MRYRTPPTENVLTLTFFSNTVRQSVSKVNRGSIRSFHDPTYSQENIHEIELSTRQDETFCMSPCQFKILWDRKIGMLAVFFPLILPENIITNFSVDRIPNTSKCSTLIIYEFILKIDIIFTHVVNKLTTFKIFLVLDCGVQTLPIVLAWFYLGRTYEH